jgi:hypothetical protein
MNPNPFSNLKDQYVGGVLKTVSDTAQRSFKDIFASKPAEPPLPRSIPHDEEENGGFEDGHENRPPYQPYQANPQYRQPPPQYQAPPQYGQPNWQYYQQPPQYQPSQNWHYPPPPMPAPVAPRYKIDEPFLRNMAKLQAATHIKYLTMYTGFARSVVGSLAASNAMVAMVERADADAGTMTDEEKEIALTCRRAVEKRRQIEASGTKILSDSELREIYEELIFQDMWDKHERGELTLQSPDSFFKTMLVLTSVEILDAGKEVIGERIAGTYKKATKFLSGKK